MTAAENLQFKIGINLSTTGNQLYGAPAFPMHSTITLESLNERMVLAFTMVLE